MDDFLVALIKRHTVCFGLFEEERGILLRKSAGVSLSGTKQTPSWPPSIFPLGFGTDVVLLDLETREGDLIILSWWKYGLL